MLTSKRIFVSLSPRILTEIDKCTALGSRNRSEVIIEALEFWFGERRRLNMLEEMRQGYVEMAEINLGIACESCHWEEEALVHSISRLLENVGRDETGLIGNGRDKSRHSF